MTILNVKNPIFTQTRTFKVNVECLTDDMQPVTSGRIACVLNRNMLIDIKEVKMGKTVFEVHIPESLEQGNEYTLRFLFSGSVQAEQKSTSSLLLFNKNYEQRVNAEIIVDDYYCERGETVQFKSYLKVQDNIRVSGKAVLKLDEQTIAQTVINNNRADFEFTIPQMILNDHALLWKYGTNVGIFVNTSVLVLKPKISVDFVEYHEDNGVSDEVRQILKETQVHTSQTGAIQSDTITSQQDTSSTSITDKIKKLF